jgi:hypothetical protein
MLSTITIKKPRFASLEKITRQSAAEAILQRALARVKPEGDGEAHFRFGKAARFEQATQQSGPSIRVEYPDDTGQIDDPEIVVLDFDEIDREEETIRVENLSDSEQYVMVKRCKRILFQGRADGIYRRFNFKYDD